MAPAITDDGKKKHPSSVRADSPIIHTERRVATVAVCRWEGL
jgi:hypothetical protein